MCARRVDQNNLLRQYDARKTFVKPARMHFARTARALRVSTCHVTCQTSKTRARARSAQLVIGSRTVENFGDFVDSIRADIISRLSRKSRLSRVARD